MLKLCGFGASDFYCKARMALLEKGVPFEEELVWTSQQPNMLSSSPMGKVPFLVTPEGPISESQAIVEYLEDAFPANSLYPADPYAKAKCRELITVIELYIEWVARRTFPLMFGGNISDETKEQVRAALTRGVGALGRLAKFEPFIGGSQLSYADCAAVWELPLASTACKLALGEDLLASVPAIKPYLAMMRERPHVQSTEALRRSNIEAFMERRKQAAKQ